MKFLGVPIRSFNLEITNRCTLACPACARTGNAWIESHLTDLPLSVLHNVFALEDREAFRGMRVNLCGTYGDCIYHPGFHEVIRYLKDAGLKIMMETNGSHRKLKWWEKTCDILDEHDTITFSVDGLEDTNHRYRVNARWDDIIRAMRYCAPRRHVVWKYIVFRHNEHQLESAKALAQELGIRSLIFKKSGRFAVDDPMAPQSQNFVGVVSQNRRRISQVVEAPRAEHALAERLDDEVVISPKCVSGKDLAVTALGYLFPCTPAEPSGPQSWFYESREHFNLHEHSVHDVLASHKWHELERSWKRASTAPKACLEYCGLHREFVDAYQRESRSDRPNKPEDQVVVSF